MAIPTLRRMCLTFTVLVTLAAIGDVLLSSIATSPNIARAQLNCTGVKTFTGNGIKRTPPFEVTSDQWRIRTNFKSTAPDEGFRNFEIKAYNSDDRNFQTFLALEGPGNEPFLVSAGAGRYYLDVRSADATWTITIEECGEPAPPPQPNPPRPNPPEPNPPQPNPPVDNKNCGDYLSQAAAQAVLRRNPEDPFGLDGVPGRTPSGIPGVACEDNDPPTDLRPAPGYGTGHTPRPPDGPNRPRGGDPKLPPTGGPPYAGIVGLGALSLLGVSLVVGHGVLRR